MVARSPRQQEIQSWVVGEKQNWVFCQAWPELAECGVSLTFKSP